MSAVAAERGSAVAIEGVWKFYGDYPALRDIHLAADPGTCLALIGRNGAGKTTLLRTVAGFSRPGRGKIKIGGTDPRETETRRKMGFIGHGISVYDELSAIENLMLFGKLYGLADPRKSAMEWLERTGLERVRDGLVREFSRGMRQRLAVARAFLHEPSILLLDEPFTALDDRAIAVLQRLLREALAEGKTIVMSTHQLREALELASHVALLNRGKVAFHGPRTPEMVSDPGYVYARYGEAA
ncbi:MAG TPA: heme ABC exporter ATP-binding protein CcmA [Bryobacteraceae bacterium]|jgi:heme ABC exporter ATP-binding subunit CcmA